MSEDYDERATQWFIVSDLGLTAYSALTASTPSSIRSRPTAPVGDVELRLLARNNDVLAIKKTDANRRGHLRAGLARGEGGLAPAMLVASGDAAITPSSTSRNRAFDLTDRGVAGAVSRLRALDAFALYRARRLPHRRDRLLCDHAAAQRQRRHRPDVESHHRGRAA